MERSRIEKTGAVAALLAAAVLGLSGCKQKAESQAAQPKAAGHAEGDGHDHGAEGHEGHDHGGEEAHADEVVLTPEAQERYGVKVDQAQRWVLRPTFTVPGRVTYNQEAMAHIGSRLAGRAAEILVRVGDTVTQGQPLIVVDSTELGEAQGELLQRRITAASAGPAAELAKIAWDRAKGLYEQTQGISLTEVQRREAEYNAALAAQKGAQAGVTAAENRLRLLGMSTEAIATLVDSGQVAPTYTITAPIAGVVVEREVTQGEVVGPDSGSLMTLADTTTVWVLADVPEQRVVSIAQGATAWIAASPGSDKRYEGTVALVPTSVDHSTRTAQVRIVAPAAELGLRPGMFASVELVAGSGTGSDPEPTVAVPEAAIQTVENQSAIFVPVPNEPNTFAKRAVTIGPVTGGLVPIYAGLVEGEAFVASGSFILKAELGKGGASHEH